MYGRLALFPLRRSDDTLENLAGSCAGASPELLGRRRNDDVHRMARLRERYSRLGYQLYSIVTVVTVD
jgi:hypothetical protein